MQCPNKHLILVCKFPNGHFIDYFLFLHKNKHMFSKGQIYFAILFIIVFGIIIAYTYRKDLKLHKKFYSTSRLMSLTMLCKASFKYSTSN
ncbi:MAG: hypothetical protein B7Z06_11540 [Flavobacteriales bacterium 32-35-8]|nr:MAG: hypothetical protein B7Z06_11540 [Flavobacteriales bacterium 32-35-8]